MVSKIVIQTITVYLNKLYRFSLTHKHLKVIHLCFSALESGRVDLIASNNTGHGSPQNLPLRATVWTSWSGDKATSNAQAQLRTLIE